MHATKRVSPAVGQIHPTAIDEFKNANSVEFLGLAAEHSEADLHGALLRNIGRFLAELGRDFCFVGSQHPVQVGNPKDDEVVEYALARTTSPTLVAEYQTFLPPKELLRAKLHELYAQLSPDKEVRASNPTLKRSSRRP